MERVSYHTNLEGIRDRDVYQIFLGSPRRYIKPDATLLMGINKDIVVHCPYWTQIARESYDKSYIMTLSYTIKLAKELDRVGQRYIVIHPGARTEDMSIARAMDCMRDFCIRWLSETSTTDVVLCLENDSGSKKGTKMGSVKILQRIIEDIDDPRLKMTFDTEHAYANGFDLSNEKRLAELIPIVEVIHFNSIPDFVVRGSHVDRHTETKFSDSKNGFKYLFNVYNVLYNGIRPFIMEIDNGLVGENLSYLKSFLDVEGRTIDVQWTEIE